MTYNILNELLDNYILGYNQLKLINKKLSKKKCRNENFPSHISENIVKFALYKKYGIMPNWDTKKGDLELLNKQLEIKGFMSDGPSSFGPNENWDWIYVVDGIDFINKRFKIYEIKLSNKDKQWINIVISGQKFDANVSKLPDNLEILTVNELNKLCKERGITQCKNKQATITKLTTEKVGSKFNEPTTFGSIADKKSRGKLRCSFYKVCKPQLNNHCKIIFDGHISELAF